MEIAVRNMAGEQVGEVELPAQVFEAPINSALMHQALVRQLANARQGTHKAMTRSEVNRSKAKWYRQKGTGRARHGSRNAPIFVGGGVAHGPKPRSYRQQMPRKMRRAALRSALSVKAADAQIVLLDELRLEQPKTREFVAILERLAVSDSALVLLAEQDEVVQKSARNVPNVKTLRASYLNIRDLLGYENVVIPLDSLDVITSLLGQPSV
jgi:large subunit ribosomal protein L4